MIIKISKFGSTLTSRQFGKEAMAAFLPTLNMVSKKEKIIVDFEKVNTFSPSWGDEFLTPLVKEYGDRLFLRSSNNLSVQASLKMLEEVNGYRFKREV